MRCLKPISEEARLADPAYARAVAEQFVGSLAHHGTTTALVFGAHFLAATDALFEADLGRGAPGGPRLRARRSRTVRRQPGAPRNHHCAGIRRAFPRSHGCAV